MPYYRTQADLAFLRQKTAERDMVARPRVQYYALDETAVTLDEMTRETKVLSLTYKDPIDLPARIKMNRSQSRSPEGGFKTSYKPELQVSVQILINLGIVLKPRDRIDSQGAQYRVDDTFKEDYLTNVEHNLELRVPLYRIEDAGNADQPSVTLQSDE